VASIARGRVGATGRWPRPIDQTSASSQPAQSGISSLTALFFEDAYKLLLGWVWEFSLDSLNT
jgi:hypothetical protein